MTKILITGGCGFIGSNLIDYLLKKTDWKIVILDNLSAGKLEDVEKIFGFLDRCTFIKGDIRNKDDVSKVIQGCDYVVNLAAQVGVMPSIDDPVFDAEINVLGTINVLKASVDNKIKKFVQASSAAPLGNQDMPLDEKKVPAPLSPYGASKMACEGYCSAFSGSYGLNTVVLRFSNVYGPNSYGKGSVIPLFIKKILRKEIVTIYGSGEQTRDFIHVKDICQGIHLSLSKDLPDKFNLFQLSSGKETSINQLFALLKTKLEEKGVAVDDPKYEPERPGEIARNYSDITKIKNVIGYEPEFMLDKGLDDTIGWFIKQN